MNKIRISEPTRITPCQIEGNHFEIVGDAYIIFHPADDERVIVKNCTFDYEPDPLTLREFFLWRILPLLKKYLWD